MFKPEILSPAGSLELALAAFDGGADAVYLGLDQFSARARATNFSFDELGRLLRYAHKLDRKVYVAFNTLLYQNELAAAMEYLAELDKLRPDALIIQDLGVWELCNTYFPNLRLHASTQMGIHNRAGLQIAAQNRIKRVILERQVTLDELRHMAREAPLELEVFVHGSLCVSLSGRCLLSASLYSEESGNRGRCKQPCRKRLTSDGKPGFYLSPGDLDASSLMEEFRRLKIASLKIEGRLRSSDYIWKTARAYRLLTDDPKNAPEAQQLLASTVSRSSSVGFYTAMAQQQLIRPDVAGVFGQTVGRVTGATANTVTIAALDRMHLGDRMRLAPPEGGEGKSFTLDNMSYNGKPVVKARAGQTIAVACNFAVKVGFILYKIGENGFDFARQSQALPPFRHHFDLKLDVSAKEWVIANSNNDCVWRRTVDFAAADKRPLAAETVREEFMSCPLGEWEPGDIEIAMDGQFFVPASVLKALKKEYYEFIAPSLQLPDRSKVLYQFYQDSQKPQAPAAAQFPAEVFELPGFCPELELDAVAQKIQTAYQKGVRNFALTSLYQLPLLQKYRDLTLLARYPLPVCNSFAAKFLQRHGCNFAEAWCELDEEKVAALAAQSPIAIRAATAEVPLLVTRLKLPKLDRYFVGCNGKLSEIGRGEISKTVK